MYEYPTDDRNRNSQVLRQERNMRRIFAAATVAIAAAGLSTFATSPTMAAVLSTGVIPDPLTGVANGPYGGFQCADVAGGSLTPGTPVTVWDCHAGPNQQFELNGMTIYTMGGKMCLDVAGGRTADGTFVNSYTCHFGQNQRWSYSNGQIQTSVGSYPKCLDVTDLTNGSRLIINTCTGIINPGQQWQIK
jgi:hypothetical protein